MSNQGGEKGNKVETSNQNSLQFSRIKTANFHFRKSYSTRDISHNSNSTSTLSIAEQSREMFMSTYLIQGNDIDILENLAEIVKEQQSFEMYNTSHLSPYIKLDYVPCKTFQSRSEQAKKFFAFFSNK